MLVLLELLLSVPVSEDLPFDVHHRQSRLPHMDTGHGGQKIVPGQVLALLDGGLNLVFDLSQTVELAPGGAVVDLEEWCRLGSGWGQLGG